MPLTDEMKAQEVNWQTQVRWLAEQASHTEDPNEIAALCLIGQDMIEKRRSTQRGKVL